MKSLQQKSCNTWLLRLNFMLRLNERSKTTIDKFAFHFVSTQIRHFKSKNSSPFAHRQVS